MFHLRNSKRFLRAYKKMFVPIYTIYARISQKIASHAHGKLMWAEWCVDNPEYFNHDCDLYYQWGQYGRSYWVERGVYNILALQVFENPVLVELCCGEGFNTKYFYSKNAKTIWACDFDSNAIKVARKKYPMNNISYNVGDIRHDIPERVNDLEVTNVIWDAAIEHFTPEEIYKIMTRIKNILKSRNGILSGYTIVERKDKKSIEQHEYEFRDKEDLKSFLTPYFKKVTVFETIYDDRHNLYFWASDGVIPFGEKWDHLTQEK